MIHNWPEEADLEMIAQDHDLLKSFQTLNYVNGKDLETSTRS